MPCGPRGGGRCHRAGCGAGRKGFGVVPARGSDETLRAGQLPARPKIRQGWADFWGLPRSCTGARKRHERGPGETPSPGWFPCVVQGGGGGGIGGGGIGGRVEPGLPSATRFSPKHSWVRAGQAALPSRPTSDAAGPSRSFKPTLELLGSPVGTRHLRREEPWKARCQPGAGRPVPAAVPPAYGQVSPGAGSASVYRGGPCSFTASRLCGRLRGSGFPTPALSPPATAAALFPMPGAGPARVGARGAGAPAVGNASLPALPITKQQRVKYIPISAAPIWHLPPCSFMCSCTV